MKVCRLHLMGIYPPLNALSILLNVSTLHRAQKCPQLVMDGYTVHCFVANFQVGLFLHLIFAHSFSVKSFAYCGDDSLNECCEYRG